MDDSKEASTNSTPIPATSSSNPTSNLNSAITSPEIAVSSPETHGSNATSSNGAPSTPTKKKPRKLRLKKHATRFFQKVGILHKPEDKNAPNMQISGPTDFERINTARVRTGIPENSKSNLNEQIRKLSDDEVTVRFIKLLHERGVSGDLKDQMVLNTSIEKRRMYLEMNSYLDNEEDDEEEGHHEDDDDSSSSSSSHHHANTPSHFIHLLETEEDVSLETLTSLAVFLRNSKISFVEKFVDKGGLDLLLRCLAKTDKKKKSGQDLQKQQQLVMCYLAILNVKSGMQKFLDNSDAIRLLLLTLDFGFSAESVPLDVTSKTKLQSQENQQQQEHQTQTSSSSSSQQQQQQQSSSPAAPTSPNLPMGSPRRATVLNISQQIDIQYSHLRTNVLFLMAIMCHYSEEGFQTVLDAWTHYKLLKREKSLFEQWINHLLQTKYVDEEYFASSLMLMNAFVTAPNDSTTRSHMYRELMQLGVSDWLRKLKQMDSHHQGPSPFAKLMKQINSFEQYEDEERDLFRAIVYEQSERSDQERSADGGQDDIEEEIWMTITDPMEIVKLMKLKLESYRETKTSFVNIMKFLLLLALQHDPKKRISNWQTMEKVIVESIRPKEGASEVEVVQQNLTVLQQGSSQKLKSDIPTPTVVVDTAPSTNVGENASTAIPPPSLDIIPPPAPDAPSDIPPAPDAPLGDVPPPPPPPGFGGDIPPPPPPPGFGDIPPPPPPPGFGGDVPPPPPFPGAPPPPGAPMPGVLPSLPRLPEIRAKSQTKPIAVMKIPPLKFKESIWQHVVEDHIKELVVNLDLHSLEKEFAVKEKDAVDAGDVSTPTSEEKQVQSFLDGKVAYQLSLLLGYLRLPFEEIRDLVVQLNGEKLGKQTIVSMKELTPTADVMAEITNFVNIKQGKTDELAQSDTLFYTMRNIPRLKERFTVWSYKLNFSHIMANVKPDLESLQKATDEVLTSRSFRVFLGVVLLSVNFVNPKAKQVHGFKFEFLCKLRDVKTTDNSSNLLRVLCAQTLKAKKYEHLLENLSKELEHVEVAARVELPEVSKDIRELKAGAQFAKTEITALEKLTLPSEDSILQMCKDFYEDSSVQIEKVEGILESVKSKLKTVAKYFDEPEKDLLEQPHKFFKVIHTMFIQIRQTMDELEKEERALNQKKKQTDQSAQKALAMAAAAKVKEGIVDKIGNAIKDGTLVDGKRRDRLMSVKRDSTRNSTNLANQTKKMLENHKD